MSVTCELEINPSFYKKLNLEPVIKDTIKDITLKAEAECKRQCPYDTGFLRRSHSSNMDGLTGEVRNNAGYAEPVIYGHHSYSGNDYPSRVLKGLSSTNTVNNLLNKNLKKRGII